MRKLSRWLGVLSWLGLAWPWLAQGEIKPDEDVLLIPTAASPSAQGDGWDVELRGYVYEREPRRWTLGAVQAALGLGGLEFQAGEHERFRDRARMLLADQEKARRVVVTVAGHPVSLRPQRAPGGVLGKLHLADPTGLFGGTRQPTAVRLPRRDPRQIHGLVSFLGSEGVTVVSDIDDTIKVSEVRDRSVLLRNTFLRSYAAVPGMAEVYREWASKPGAGVHYLSASPWQLAPALLDFLRTNGFPEGPMDFRDFSWNRQGVAGLMAPPRAHKEAVLERLLERWPKRRWVLVGDSGELDPEIYAALAQRHPGRVAGIAIRDVTGEDAAAPRYQPLSRGLPAGTWVIFKDPKELAASASRWF